MFRHLLPNAMVATLTFLPFILNGSITTLTSLDFLGFGLPPGSPSLGELLAQGKDNLQAPWLGLTGFLVISLMLSLLIFVGEAVRDAFDPRKTFVGMARRSPSDRRRVSYGIRRRRSRATRSSRSAISRSPSARATAWSRGARHLLRHRQGRDGGAGRRVRLGQVGDGAVDPAAAALPGRIHPAGEILFKGNDLLTAEREGAARRCAATTSRMIFQEPMTSLNPLHTIERQVGEVLEAASRHAATARRAARALELLDAGRHPRAGERGSAPIRTSFPAASASA